MRTENDTVLHYYLWDLKIIFYWCNLKCFLFELHYWLISIPLSRPFLHIQELILLWQIWVFLNKGVFLYYRILALPPNFISFVNLVTVQSISLFKIIVKMIGVYLAQDLILQPSLCTSGLILRTLNITPS